MIYYHTNHYFMKRSRKDSQLAGVSTLPCRMSNSLHGNTMIQNSLTIGRKGGEIISCFLSESNFTP